MIGKEPLIEIALELEKIALNDEYFIKRKLFPNVDFYSGVIYKSMGILYIINSDYYNLCKDFHWICFQFYFQFLE